MKIEMMTIFNRLKLVGNPKFLFRMVKDTEKLFDASLAFPKAVDNKVDYSTIYLLVDGQAFEIKKGEISRLAAMPEYGCAVAIPEATLQELSPIFKVKITDSYIEKLFYQAKKAKTIRKYDQILPIIEDQFQTNMSFSDVSKNVVKQLQK